MPVNYDFFRATPWPDRLALFNGLVPEERAGLVREHIGRWLAAHREDLSAEQIELLNECMAQVCPDLYAAVRDPRAERRMKDIQDRAASLLSRNQMREALTMHWETPTGAENR